MSKTLKSKPEPILENVLHWRFDVNTFRLLGRELITDRVTAVFELVKNCYDANSKSVTVDFKNVSTDITNGVLTISDDGLGMSFEDVRDKWMVVGTDNKRAARFSAPPFNRKYVGEKGIGRFAVDKLGEKVVIKTKQAGDVAWLCVQIDWNEYNTPKIKGEDDEISLFTDIGNQYTFEPGDTDVHGTHLVISKIREVWTDQDLLRLDRELSKIISPFYPLNPPFEIRLNSNTNSLYKNKKVKADPVKFFSHQAVINFDPVEQKQEVLTFNKVPGRIDKKRIERQTFGPVTMRLFYFDEPAKRRFNAAYKNTARIDGIKIYRDAIIATPFAEDESDPNKKRDILGIDKRRWQGAFDKVGSREIIGVVEITQKNNPQIIDATNRQDFLDTPEYRRLKEFIIEQINVFGDLKEFERQEIRSSVERELVKAKDAVKNFSSEIKSLNAEIVTQNPELKGILDPLFEQARSIRETISESISEQQRFQKDVIRKESIYRSLVSMQDYAANMAHAVRTSLSKIKGRAEFFDRNYPNPKFEDVFKKYAHAIFLEMKTLRKVSDFMLSFANTDLDFEEINLKQLIENLLLNDYKQTFEAEAISVEVEISDDFVVTANRQFFLDIFQNLISNSIKAVKSVDKKTIKCSGFLDYDKFTVFFSDNGYGVDQVDEKWIFGLYNTRTADQGGAGLGLFIISERLRAVGGSIELVESEFKPKGATFKITLPFANK